MQIKLGTVKLGMVLNSDIENFLRLKCDFPFDKFFKMIILCIKISKPFG